MILALWLLGVRWCERHVYAQAKVLGRMEGFVHRAPETVKAKGKEGCLSEQSQPCFSFCLFPIVLAIQQLCDTFPLFYEIISI